jgi:hypothetical protein
VRPKNFNAFDTPEAYGDFPRETTFPGKAHSLLGASQKKVYEEGMKTLQKAFSLAALTLSSFASANEPAMTRVLEIPLEHVFIARTGFDDNDNVQAVVEGLLPNSCYSLSTTEFAINTAANKVTLVQKAIRDESGLCASDETLPPELKQGIPFWKEVSFGVLLSGNYRLNYAGQDGVASREFLVEPAPTTTVDSLRYAIISDAYVPDFVSKNEKNLEFRISGYLTSSCAALSKTSRIEKVDDIFVFLPSVVLTDEICMPANKPFVTTVKVAMPETGRYLFHVRSQAGQSRNKPFKVTE